MSTSTTELYQKTSSKLREISTLGSINGLLGWDEMVLLPEESALRGKQKAVLSGVVYDKSTDPELGDALKKLSDPDAQADLSDVQKAVVRDSMREYIRATALPKDLVTRQSELESEAYTAWVSARKDSDFSKFSPFLEEWISLSKQKANYIDSSKTPYNVLVDTYEKGMTSERLDDIFSEVRDGLVPLISVIRKEGTPPDDSLLKGKSFDVKKQAELCHSIALDLGFDIKKGRLDTSVHPFTGGSDPTDVRMTTRFKELDITEGLTGAIHETGHALYEQGRNLSPEWEGLCVSEALSMGVHESQSLLWERYVALQKPFQTYLLSKLATYFPEDFPSTVTSEQLYQAINKVNFNGLIRVESDELTYTMHVILRYEIEKGLIDGSIKVDDVPRIWSEKMENYLGVKPSKDSDGCLQDIHWSGGAFGYFPTYSLGAMYAAQIYMCAREHIPNLEDKISKGEFNDLKKWLNERIHKVGSLYPNGDELMLAVTGRKLDPKIFLSYLKRKYYGIYKIGNDEL